MRQRVIFKERERERERMNIYKKRLAWSAKSSLKGLYLKRNVEYLFKETDVKCKEEMRQRVRERDVEDL